MNRKFLMILFVCVFSFCLSGCTNNDIDSDDKLNIVTTIYPVYDWVKEVAGDSVNVTYLVDSGIDLHNYEPSVNDIIEINEADLFIYVGGHSDEWVDDVLNSDTNSLNLMDSLGDYVLYYEHDHHEEDEEHDHEEYEEDEHIWMSLNNAMLLVDVISDKLVDLDSDNEDFYVSNANNYIDELASLELEYFEVISNSLLDVIVVADRFSLLYLVTDYGLDYYAAYTGCEAEIEVSFETIIELANVVNENDLKYILILEDGNIDIAETVVDNTNGVDILEINSMQSITLSEINDEFNYLSIMRSNLDVIKIVLN